MPPGRRGRPPGSSSASTRNTNAQSTLAFGGRNNKITKPSRPSPAAGKKLDKAASPSIKQNEDVVKAIDDDPVKAPQVDDVKEEEVVNEDPILAEGREHELAIRQSQQKKEEEKRDEAEEKARKVSDAAVKRYWREREAERKAPRANRFTRAGIVHQQTLSLHEKILRHFDLSSQYGPCVGIPRARRWKRAEGLGLKPPIEVLAVLVKEEHEGNKGMERAYTDGLLGGSAVVG
ncbi:MAG: hypothetical protein Q9218_001751 [Villophora microphyllina]